MNSAVFAARLRALAHPWRLLWLLVGLLLVFGPPPSLTHPGAARAATHVPGTTYTSNTTWTTAGSPYILDGNVTVAAGATLTIDSGVVVKFNGLFRVLTVNGTLSAVGTSPSRIVFTSYQDDTVGGDSNGDGGATSGAAGQWSAVRVSSGNGLSELKFVDVKFGGYGSANWNYGALELSGASTSVTVEDATFTSNQRSAIKVGSGTSAYPGVIVRRSTMAANGSGVSVNQGWATIAAETLIRDSTGDGLWFNLTDTYTGPASSVYDSEIRTSGGRGINIGAGSNLGASYWPHGNRNNVYANTGKQFDSLNTKRTVDWRNNYWGEGVYFFHNPSNCLGQGQNSAGKLAFRSSQANPPDGPIYSAFYTVTNPFTSCYYDRVDISSIAYSPFAFRGPVGMPIGQSLGSVGGAGELAENASAYMSDPVNSATGSFTHAVTDLALPGVGVSFAFVRSYNSIDPSSGPLGRGWMHSYNSSLAIAANGDVTARGGSGQQLEFIRNADGSFTAAAGGRATLASVGTSYELKTNDQTRYAFDSSGRLTSMVDRNSQGLTFGYDGNGRLATITDAASREVTLTYEAAGLLTRVALPDGRDIDYGYTGGRLTSVTDARNKVWTYTYEAAGLLEKEVDPLNHTVFRNVYGMDGRVIEQYDALNNKTSFAWDQATQTQTATDARGKVWKDVYSNNLLVKRTDPLGNETQFAYAADLGTTSVTDARGKTTTMTYDSRGNLLTRTAPAPLSYQEVFTYDSQNNLASHSDGRGNTTTYGYNAAGNLTSITQPGSVATQIGRDARGLVTSITDPRNKTTTFEHDAAGNLTAIVSPLSHRETYAYDASGRLTSRVDPRGNVAGANPDDYRTTLTYDATDKPLTATNPLGHMTAWAYDDARRISSITDAKNRTTGYSYDAVGHLTRVTAPDTTQTNSAYDAVGNLTSRTDARNNTTSYVYDNANRLASATSPLAKTWTYTYDANGNVTRVVDAAIAATDYAYDAINRLTAIDYSDTTPDVTYAYDGNSNRTSMTDGGGTQTYVYDTLNRLTEVTRSTDTFTYAYDAASNLTQRTYPGGRVTEYTYDDSSRLASVTSLAKTTTYVYDVTGNVTQTQLPSTNGYVETRTYDRAGRLTETRHERTGVTLSYAQYDYDQVANPTTITTANGAATLAYDSFDRLTSATGGGMNVSYAYDSVGNRTSDTRSAGTTSYTYNADDQLTSSSGPGGNVTYTYDANGNQTQAGTRTFAYDLATKLTSTTHSGTTTTYAYDGDGVRLQASAPTGTINYLWDLNNALPQLALERDGTGAALRSYLQGNAGPISMEASGQSAYFHRDAIGSTVNVTSTSGATQWTYAYEPYGEALTTTQNDPGAPPNPARFAGEHLDPTGLYHVRARQYEPAAGRFTSTDPLPPSISSPGISSYAYADNRPTVMIDPSGMGAVWGGSSSPVNCDALAAKYYQGPLIDAWISGCRRVNAALDWLWENRLKVAITLASAFPFLLGPRLAYLLLQATVRWQTSYGAIARGINTYRFADRALGPATPGSIGYPARFTAFIWGVVRHRIWPPTYMRKG